MKASLANFRSVPALLAFALTAAVGLWVDLWSKREAFDRLAPWGIEQVDEIGERRLALQVVPRRWFPAPDAARRVQWHRHYGLRLGDTVPPAVEPPPPEAVGPTKGPAAPPPASTTTPSDPAAGGVMIVGVAQPMDGAFPLGDVDRNTQVVPGDVLVSVGGRRVGDPKQADAAFEEATNALNAWFDASPPPKTLERANSPPPKGIEFEVVRGRQTLQFRLRPAEQSIVHPFLPSYLNFQALVNQGAVFGIGQGQRWLFLVVSGLAIGFIGFLFATSGRHRFYQFVLGLLLAGVIGNMYDRYQLGFVRDMLHMLPGRTWPGTTREVFPWIYNLADSYLCAGVGLIFLYTLRGSPATRDRHGAEAKAGTGSDAAKTAETATGA